MLVSSINPAQNQEKRANSIISFEMNEINKRVFDDPLQNFIGTDDEYEYERHLLSVKLIKEREIGYTRCTSRVISETYLTFHEELYQKYAINNSTIFTIKQSKVLFDHLIDNLSDCNYNDYAKIENQYKDFLKIFLKISLT